MWGCCYLDEVVLQVGRVKTTVSGPRNTAGVWSLPWRYQRQLARPVREIVYSTTFKLMHVHVCEREEREREERERERERERARARERERERERERDIGVCLYIFVLGHAHALL